MMKQLDFTETTEVDYLYSELQKTKHSMSKQLRALFALITEMKKDINQIQSDKVSEKVV